MRTAYFVLGMHRSGTSALASTLDGLGITLGESLLPPSEDNPKGYFENKAVQEFNESLLVSKGHGWDDVFFNIEDINELEYQRLVISASLILEKEFSGFENFAVKDPRLCLLLPIWLDACRKLGVQPKAILAHRNPLEIAQSLKKRNGMTLINSLALWADHMFKAELYSRSIERTLVSYEKLLVDFNSVAKQFAVFTGGKTVSELDETTVIDKALRHHKVNSQTLSGVPGCLTALLNEYAKGSLDADNLDTAMSEFSSLKTMFFNANKTALFQQVFEERRKYKALKDDYFGKLQANEKKLTKQKDELDSHKADIEKQKSDKRILTESIRQRDERIRNESEKNNLLNKELNKVQGQYEQLALDNKNNSQQVKSLSDESFSLKERLRELKSSLEYRDERIRAEQDKIKGLEKENSALSHEIRKGEINAEMQKVVFEQLKSEKSSLKSEKQRIESQLEETKHKVSTLIKQHAEQKEQLERELSENKDKLEELAVQFTEQKEHLNDAEQNQRELKALNEALVADLKKADSELDKYRTELANLTELTANLTKQQQISAHEKDSLTRQLELLKRKGAEETDAVNHVHKQLREAEHEIVELKKQLDSQKYSAKRERESIATAIQNWSDLINAPVSTLATHYTEHKSNHSRLSAGFKTAFVSGRLDNAIERFNLNVEAAKIIPLEFVACFDEAGYFACNEDVEVAVESGEFISGLDHFLKFGWQEAMEGKRKLHPRGTLFNPNLVKDNVENAFSEFLAKFYSEISNRSELLQNTSKEKQKTQAVQQEVIQSSLLSNVSKRRPAPNHISNLSTVPKIDIILPVYNALEDVKACIESLYTNETIPFNLIIIDDCSEEETRTWLECAQNKYGFNLSRNAENLRFTKTVNRGFSQSDGDYVVLLNSDTIVTAYWLEKILCCFHSDNNTGIVGPLSNAASWQTVPVREDKVNGGWLVNEIPEGYSIELMGQLVETISLRQYPEVPSVNGFCYVIKRDVINDIGTLDEEYFPTGYGEEDDFSIRARKAGYNIRVADDTYIFHAKSKSYTKEVRKVLTVGGRKSLDKKHGKEEIERLISVWKAEPLLPEIGRDIESFMHVSSGNKKVVYTAIFGNYDNLKTPEYINPDWDYVCFTDNENVKSDVFTVKHVSQRFENVTKNARMIKLLSHIFLINYEYSLWIDGSVKLRGRNINELIDRNLSSDYISLHSHVKRDCVYEEADACMLAKKDGTDILAKQIAEYRNEGLPESVGVFETAEIIRKQNAAEVHILNALWWQQLDAFSIRDQVALPYVFWKHNFTSFQMEGNQWLDAYFHMYKHRSAQNKHNTPVEILISVESNNTEIQSLVKNVFEKTNYTNFNVTVLSGTKSLSNQDKTSLLGLFPNKVKFEEYDDEVIKPHALNNYIKKGKAELCCLLTADVALFNSDWLDVLVDGFSQDENAMFAGPTILSQNFEFIASSVRVKRKQGKLTEIFNNRKVGGTGAVLAVHQACILFDRQQFVRLGGFSKAFNTLRSAAVELFHRNTEDKKHTLLVSNSEVIVKNDSEDVEMEALSKLL